MEEKVIATFTDNLSHPFFDYLTGTERKIILSDIEQGFSRVVEFKTYDIVLVMVVTFYQNCIHIHEMSGKIGRYFKHAHTFIEALARFRKAEKISFCTKRKAIQIFAEKSGFKKVDDIEFERII